MIVLAGGEGRRLGGADKAALTMGTGTLLDRALAAAAGRPTVVVGPDRPLPVGVWATREDPPGGGPAAAVAAGFATLRGALAGAAGGAVSRAGGGAAVGRALVAVLAVDQPGVTCSTLARLARAVLTEDLLTEDLPGGDLPGGDLPGGDLPGGDLPGLDRAARGPVRGAVLVSRGRRQYTVGVFPAGALDAALRGRHSWHGAALRQLLDPLVGIEVAAEGDEAGDVDTPQDLARWRAAESATRRPAGADHGDAASGSAFPP